MDVFAREIIGVLGPMFKAPTRRARSLQPLDEDRVALRERKVAVIFETAGVAGRHVETGSSPS